MGTGMRVKSSRGRTDSWTHHFWWGGVAPAPCSWPRPPFRLSGNRILLLGLVEYVAAAAASARPPQRQQRPRVSLVFVSDTRHVAITQVNSLVRCASLDFGLLVAFPSATTKFTLPPHSNNASPVTPPSQDTLYMPVYKHVFLSPPRTHLFRNTKFLQRRHNGKQTTTSIRSKKHDGTVADASLWLCFDISTASTMSSFFSTFLPREKGVSRSCRVCNEYN